jgi:hypothetical protein
MAIRKIHETRVGANCAVRIYRNSEFDEYIVKTVVNGRVQGGKDGGAFENDKAAARGTAAAQVRWLRKHRNCR